MIRTARGLARRPFLKSLLGVLAVPLARSVKAPAETGPASMGLVPISSQTQPVPTRTMVVYSEVCGQVVTAVHRQWKDGEEKACRLCEEGTCCASRGACLLAFYKRIPKNEAKLYSARGVKWNS